MPASFLSFFSLKEAAVLSRLSESKVRREIEHGVIRRRTIAAGAAHRLRFAEADILYFALLRDLSGTIELTRPTRTALHRLTSFDRRAVGAGTDTRLLLVARRFHGTGAVGGRWNLAELFVSHAHEDEAFRKLLIAELATAWSHTVNPVLTVNWDRLLEEIAPRLYLYRRGRARITEEEDVLGAEPVFAGTRIPVRHIGAMRKKGEPLRQILEDYPPLTTEDVDFAELFAVAHPPVGRPKSRDTGPTSRP